MKSKAAVRRIIEALKKLYPCLLYTSCTGCGHEVMLPRAKAEKGIKKILEREEKADE